MASSRFFLTRKNLLFTVYHFPFFVFRFLLIMFSSPVTQELDRLHIPYRVFTHPGPVQSLEQAAAERGQQPEQIIRSLLFRLSEVDFVMALMAGAQQVDWKTLRRYVGEKRLTTASEEEVLRITGYQRGAVSPFGLPQPLRTWPTQPSLSRTKFLLAPACAAARSSSVPRIYAALYPLSKLPNYVNKEVTLYGNLPKLPSLKIDGNYTNNTGTRALINLPGSTGRIQPPNLLQQRQRPFSLPHQLPPTRPIFT